MIFSLLLVGDRFAVLHNVVKTKHRHKDGALLEAYSEIVNSTK